VGTAEVHASDFIFDPHGHGWQLDRARFDASLRDAAAEAGAEMRGARVASAVRDTDGGWRVVLRAADGGREAVCCDVVVDTTGRSAVLARQQGAARLREDDLVAFYARFRPARAGDRDARTLLESTPHGWWYTALVPAGERVAYGRVARGPCRAAVGRRVRGGAAGHETRGGRAGRVRLRDHRAAARGGRRKRAAGPVRGDGWVAAGDAALSFDPLSSQGILTALYTGLRAGEALHLWLQGDRSALAAYEDRLREIHQAYARNRITFYGFEARWANHPFWRSRAPTLVTGG
jgi:flavin-dependent dehydrogenase